MPPPTAHNFPSTRLPDDHFLAHNTECDICKVAEATDIDYYLLAHNSEGNIHAPAEAVGEDASDEDLRKAIIKIDACHHVFHKLCLTTWIDAQLCSTGTGTCPMCRRNLVEGTDQMRTRHIVRRLRSLLVQLRADSAAIRVNSGRLWVPTETPRASIGAVQQDGTAEGQLQAAAATPQVRSATVQSRLTAIDSTEAKLQEVTALMAQLRVLQPNQIDHERVGDEIEALRAQLADSRSGWLDMQRNLNRMTVLEAERDELLSDLDNLDIRIGETRITGATARELISLLAPVLSQQGSNTVA
jgi:hypothetical protein